MKNPSDEMAALMALRAQGDKQAAAAFHRTDNLLTDQSEDGLGLVRALVDQAPRWIRTGGWILVEVSPDLSRRVGGILRRNGYRDVKSHKDSLGATRVIAGRR